MTFGGVYGVAAGIARDVMAQGAGGEVTTPPPACVQAETR